MKLLKVELQNKGTVNKNAVYIKTDAGEIELDFSYETIVGFVKNGRRVVCENAWSTTTGKFLNELEPDHKKRLPRTEFESELEKLFN